MDSTADETLKRFLNELIGNQASKSTQKHYRYLLTDLSKHYPEKSFEEITQEELVAFFAGMDGEKAKSTVNQQRAQIKRFYKWLEGDDEEYPQKVKWIKVKPPQSKIQRGDLITKDEMKKFLNVARDYMEKALLVMLYESGARVAEFCSITLGNVKINSDEVLVTIRHGKTGPRTLTLVRTLTPLKTYLNFMHPCPRDPNTHLFFRNNRPLTPWSVKKILDELTQLANVQRRITPHIFRHSRATELAKKGWNEAKLRYYFGWTERSHMPTVYTHLAFGDTRNEIRQMEGLPVEDDSLMSSETLSVETPFEILVSEEESSIWHEKYNHLSREVERLKEASLRNERRFGALLHLSQPMSEEYILGLRNPNGSAILTQSSETYSIDIDRWIDENVKDADQEDREFIKSQLEKYEKERLEARREAEMRWLEQRFGRGTDDKKDDRD